MIQSYKLHKALWAKRHNSERSLMRKTIWTWAALMLVTSITAMADSIRTLPDLQSVTVYEITLGTIPHSFAWNGTQLTTRLPDPLTDANNDFFEPVYPWEKYDVFYSNADGTFNINGAFLTIEGVFRYPQGLYPYGGMNINEVELTFGGSNPHSQYADFVASIALGSICDQTYVVNCIPGSEAWAVDHNLNTFPLLGQTSLENLNERFRLTVGFYGISDHISDNQGPIPANVGLSVNPVAINNGTTLTANVNDSTTGGSNIAAAEYNIDGGSFIPMNAVDLSFNQVTENVIALVAPFSAPGLHTLCVRGKDAAGNTGASECILLVVYDPSGGFVTGGGAVNSPAGADLANTSAAGPATFGFVSKYLPGASNPSGNLEFQFREGNLNFKSTSMDWLVVTGEPRAIFRGSGTINGVTVCKFEVDAWDGSFQPGSVDAFGLKIFSCAGGGDRYSLAATPLKQGSIIIHK